MVHVDARQRHVSETFADSLNPITSSRTESYVITALAIDGVSAGSPVRIHASPSHSHVPLNIATATTRPRPASYAIAPTMLGPVLGVIFDHVVVSSYTSPCANTSPINTIRELLPQLRSGKISRGVIGVSISKDPITKDMAQALGLPNTSGALVSLVTEDRPAAKAGIKRGDVIVEYNGRPVSDSDSLVAMVVATKPGTTVPITIYRDNQRKTLNITPDELDLEAEANGGRSPRPDSADREPPTATDFGMQLEAITPDVARQLALPRGRGGAIVADVDRGSVAANAGVQPNDVIVEVNRQEVANVSQVTRALQNAPAGRPVFLVIWREGQELFVTMTKR